MLHVWSEGAIAGEDPDSPLSKIMTTIIAALSEFMIDFHFWKSQVTETTCTHGHNHNIKDFFNGVKNSFTRVTCCLVTCGMSEKHADEDVHGHHHHGAHDHEYEESDSPENTHHAHQHRAQPHHHERDSEDETLEMIPLSSPFELLAPISRPSFG
jgi:hypothetical protein